MSIKKSQKLKNLQQLLVLNDFSNQKLNHALREQSQHFDEAESRKKRFSLSPVWGFAAVFTLLLNLSIFSGWYFIYKQTILSFTSSPQVVGTLSLRGSIPDKIQIPELDLEQSILPASITNGIWQTSQTNPTYLISSARPDEGGNIVIYGHNLPGIFGKLKQLKVGQSVELTTQMGKLMRYEVAEIKVVKPSEVSIVEPTNFEVLTIYTCTGLFDSQRLVIRAYPKQAITQLGQ